MKVPHILRIKYAHYEQNTKYKFFKLSNFTLEFSIPLYILKILIWSIFRMVL